MAILECKDLTKRYGAKLALNKASFNIEPGRIVGLLGPNGSGKTTFLKICNGLLTPSEGGVLISGTAPGPSTKAVISYLPGRKILLKGNHDYYWQTAKKLHDFCDANGFDSIDFLHNNSFFAGGVNICGSRGWDCDVADYEAGDAKVLARELLRLRASFEARADKSAETVCFLHYPPLFGDTVCHEVISLMSEYDVKRCFYGHIHSAAIRYARTGFHHGIDFALVSADNINFMPAKV